jgi:hypothetical protein
VGLRRLVRHQLLRLPPSGLILLGRGSTCLQKA